MGGPWKLPERRTRQRTRALRSLDAGHTDAGAHSSHRPLLTGQPHNGRAILGINWSRPLAEMAGFHPSTNGRI
jgi:hypothetical protein